MSLKVICFSQQGCMGCEEQAPIILEVSNALGIRIEEIDAVQHPELIKKYGLRVTPTTIILDGDEQKERFEGIVHREGLETAIKKYM